MKTLVLVPRNVAISILLVYRKFISPLYGDVCRFYPSCSAYALGTIQQKGLIYGIPKSIVRIIRCNPWSSGGVHDFRVGPNWITVTRLGFVVPRKKED